MPRPSWRRWGLGSIAGTRSGQRPGPAPGAPAPPGRPEAAPDPVGSPPSRTGAAGARPAMPRAARTRLMPSTAPTSSPAVHDLKDLTRLVQRAPGFPEILAALKDGRGATLDGAWGSAGP